VPKKFKFKLASVLRYRQILKDSQEAKLMQAARACQETEALIQTLDDQKHATYQAMIENLQQGFSLVDKVNQDSFNHMVLAEKSKEQSRLAKRKRAHDYENAKYISLSRSHLIVDKLKDKAIDLHHKALLEEENKLIDDLVSTRFRVKD
jgi:flagellar FliJ protein